MSDTDWRNRAQKYMLDLHTRSRELSHPGKEDPDKVLMMTSLALILERLIEDTQRKT